MTHGLSRTLTLTTGFFVVGSIAMAQLSQGQTSAVQKQLEAANRQASAVARQRSFAEKGTDRFRSEPVYFADREPSTTWQDHPCDYLSSDALKTLAADAATNDIPAGLIRAVIAEESAGLPCAVSVKGALGLMQLMPGTARDMGVTDPFDAEQNVRGGARFLKDLLQRYSGDLSLTLAAYNAGPVRVDALRDVPPIAETQRYVRRVLDRFRLDQVD